MLARRRGQIVNVASVAGLIAFQGVYSASKFGLRGFSLALRRELLGSGVHVSLVSPGFVRTELTARARLPMPGPELVARAIADVLERPRREVVVPELVPPARRHRPLRPRSGGRRGAADPLTALRLRGVPEGLAWRSAYGTGPPSP